MKLIKLSSIDDKMNNLLWILVILVAYSVIDFYITYLLGKVQTQGYLIHLAAIIAIGILMYGLLTGKRITK